jgi:hypothetical protein
MRLFRRWIVVVGLLALPSCFLVFLRSIPGFDVRWFSASGHLVLTSAIALCALFVAVVAVVSATRCPQSGVVWLALGCSFVGLCMLGHGLCTPGTMDHPSNQWIGRFPLVALAGFALCLFIAGRPQDRGLNRWVGHHPLLTVLVPIVPASLFVAAVVTGPTRFHGGSPIVAENTLKAAVGGCPASC